MTQIATVAFSDSHAYEVRLSEAEVAAQERDAARQWLFAEYEAFECAPRNPVGKILLLDVILDVAKYGGEARFAANGEWARQYAICCLASLARPTLRVDVPGLTVS